MAVGLTVVSCYTKIKITPSILVSTTRFAHSSLMVVLESVGSITPLECVIASVGAKA